MDAAELKDVMGRYRDLVYRIAYTYLRNPADADDVAQDVFVQLMKCDVAFESDEHVRRWLARVAINRCKSLFRMSWRWIENIDDHARSLSIPDKQEVRDVLAALLALPENTACLWSCITTEDSRPTRSPRYSKSLRQLPEPALHADAPS